MSKESASPFSLTELPSDRNCYDLDIRNCIIQNLYCLKYRPENVASFQKNSIEEDTCSVAGSSNTLSNWSSLTGIAGTFSRNRGSSKKKTFKPTECLRKHRSNYLVAVKRIIMENLDDQQWSSLIKEIKLAKLCRHVNLMPILASFIVNSELWQIMPLTEFGSASDLCKPLGLSEEVIVFIIRDLLSGLQYLHGQGIIHNGVRGSRILIHSNGRCMLTGFKYATVMISNAKRKQVMYEYPKNARRNLNWLSPELLEQNLSGYNERSDIYSVGITCCELANGRVPYESLLPTEMLLDKLSGNAPKILDDTCEELFLLQYEELREEERYRFRHYRTRHFSDLFRSFTSDLCLAQDPESRPPPEFLLKTKFIKQAKKFKSLLDHLPNKEALLEKYSEVDNDSFEGFVFDDNPCPCHRHPCACYPSRPNSSADRIFHEITEWLV